MSKKPLITACEKVGGQAALARILGVKPPSVNQWVNGDRPVPAERCPDIEAATAGAVTCEEQRPDINWAVLRCGCEKVSPDDTAEQKAAA